MYTIFLLLSAEPAWLRLSRPERARLAELHVQAPLKARPGLIMRYFDAEAFTAQCSDVMLLQTESLKDYSFFIEALRDSPIFTAPYFRLEQVIPTIEEGFRAYEATLNT